MDTQSRVCTKCKFMKELSCFGSKKGGRYGVASICKPCFSQLVMKYQRKDKPKYNLYRKAYYEKRKLPVLAM